VAFGRRGWPERARERRRRDAASVGGGQGGIEVHRRGPLSGLENDQCGDGRSSCYLLVPVDSLASQGLMAPRSYKVDTARIGNLVHDLRVAVIRARPKAEPAIAGYACPYFARAWLAASRLRRYARPNPGLRCRPKQGTHARPPRSPRSLRGQGFRGRALLSPGEKSSMELGSFLITI
jgi:hypothetical protein